MQTPHTDDAATLSADVTALLDAAPRSAEATALHDALTQLWVPVGYRDVASTTPEMVIRAQVEQLLDQHTADREQCVEQLTAAVLATVKAYWDAVMSGGC